MRKEEKEEEEGWLRKSPAEGYISLDAAQFVTKAHVSQPFFAQLPSPISMFLFFISSAIDLYLMRIIFYPNL